MTIALEASKLGSDITECDREPIHVPGSIQPHGLLLIANHNDQTIVGEPGGSTSSSAPTGSVKQLQRCWAMLQPMR